MCMYIYIYIYSFNKKYAILSLTAELLTLEVLRVPQAVHGLCSFLFAWLNALNQDRLITLLSRDQLKRCLFSVSLIIPFPTSYSPLTGIPFLVLYYFYNHFWIRLYFLVFFFFFLLSLFFSTTLRANPDLIIVTFPGLRGSTWMACNYQIALLSNISFPWVCQPSS